MRTSGRLLTTVMMVALLAGAIALPAASLAASPPDVPATIDNGRFGGLPENSIPLPDEPAVGQERVDLRTADSRTFERSDGKFVTQLFDENVYYRPTESQDWAPIDTRFHSANHDDAMLSVTASPARIDLAPANSPNGFLRLNGGGHSISFALPDGLARGGLPVVGDDGVYADFTNFLDDGVGLRVLPQPDGFKSFLILSHQPTDSVFRLQIDAPGLSVAPAAIGYDFVSSDGSVAAHFPAPYMVDSSDHDGVGSGEYSDAVQMNIVPTASGKFEMTLTADTAFLADAVYPVYLDPTTTDFPTASTTANDTFAASKYPNSNFKAYQRPDSPFYYELWHGREPGTPYYSEDFIRFNDLRTTLGTVQIDDARLELYPYWQYYHYTERPTWVRRVLQDWDAGSLTWNNRPAVDGSDLGAYTTTQGTWSHIDVTDFVQHVVNNEWANHGLMLHADGTGQGNWKRFVSRNDTSSPDRRPHLSITWEPFSPQISSPDQTDTASRTLAWFHSPVAAATTSYSVEVATSTAYGSSNVATSGTVSGTAISWDIPSSVALTPGHAYYWHVRAKYGVNTSWSPWSANGQFTDQSDMPVATNDFPDYDATDQRSLSWLYDDGDGNSSTNGAQSQYEVQVASDDGFGSGTILADSGVTSSSSARSWTIPSSVTLAEGGTYYWRVEVYDGAAWSDWTWTQFVYQTADDGTGLDDSGAFDALAADDNGYVPQLGESIKCDTDCGVNYPDSCPDGCTGAPATGTISTPIFHEKKGVWCVPAILHTILKKLIGGTYATTTTLPEQQRFKRMLLAIKYDVTYNTGGTELAKFYANPDGYRPLLSMTSNGVDSYIGIRALNAELSDNGKATYHLDRPSDQSELELWAVDHVLDQRPMFVEVNVRDQNWLWPLTHRTTRLTHATVVLGFSSYGAKLDVAEPYTSDTLCVKTTDANGFVRAAAYDPTATVQMPYTSTAELGCRWNTLNAGSAWLFMDRATTPSVRLPVWF